MKKHTLPGALLHIRRNPPPDYPYDHQDHSTATVELILECNGFQLRTVDVNSLEQHVHIINGNTTGNDVYLEGVWKTRPASKMCHPKRKTSCLLEGCKRHAKALAELLKIASQSPVFAA